MNISSMRVFLTLPIMWAFGATTAHGQVRADQKPQLAEEVFKNITVLKGISVNEFMGTMGFFSASLGLNCVYCHVADSMQDWQKFAEDVPRKRMARVMIQMVNNINKTNFGGRRVITCYSCHRGAQRPKVVPSLTDQYGVPPEDPNEIEITPNAPSGASADQILDKFIAAVGGTQRLAAVSSFTAKGTYEGYETYHQKVPLEIYAKSPNQMTTIVHTQNGDSTTVFDGQAGWFAGAERPVPLLAMTQGAEIDGAKLDAGLFFPGRIKQALTQWRTGFPVTTIEDADVVILQGAGAGKTRFKLFFDRETGLLSRQLRYAETVVGTNPIQVDYANYREVNGVKIPFKWTVTWTNGQSFIELSDVQANTRIDANRFSKPAPAVVKPARAVGQ
jgi:photosynthetic reaction center cytochrome c subunit